MRILAELKRGIEKSLKEKIARRAARINAEVAEAEAQLSGETARVQRSMEVIPLALALA